MNGAPFGLPPRQELARRRLDDLGRNPPQVLVLEGGTASEREAAALYYAAALNCARLLESAAQDAQDAGSAPCGVCPACVQVRERTYIDLIYLDGAEQSIKVDDIREVRQKVGEPPRGPGRRVVALTEAQGLTPQAANALLKSMEEPRPGNCFVLLAPQRERLLPTLVSRSWVLTLAWPEPSTAQCPSGDGPEAPFLEALERFWQTGHGLFGLTGAKGKLTRPVAQLVVLALSKELAQALAGRPCSGLGAFFAQRLGVEGLRALDLHLETAQEALIGMANPALVLERLAVRVWLLSR